MKGELTLRNWQRLRRVDTPWLRRMLRWLLEEELSCAAFHLDVHLVGEAVMIRLNEKHLRHQGCTDVIAFDYSDAVRPGVLAGEIFVCVPEAERQARRFRTTCQSELLRYLIHGLLHLRGYDDHSSADRRRMKREEDRLLRRTTRCFARHHTSRCPAAAVGKDHAVAPMLSD